MGEEESEELFEEVDLGLLGVDALTKFSDGIVLLLNNCAGVSESVLEVIDVSSKFVRV